MKCYTIDSEEVTRPEFTPIHRKYSGCGEQWMIIDEGK